MLDPDLKTQLDQIDSHLVELKNKKGSGVWRAFFNGMFGALGYVAGLAIVLVILGWVLNKTGLLPAFKKQISSFQEIIDNAKQLTTGAKEKLNNPQGQTIVLPDGREVRVK